MSDKISRKTIKRKIRKEKKRQEYIKKLESQKVKFKIIQLLSESNFDSKPNTVKFLQQYVQAIRCLSDRNFQFYPSFQYHITKVFVVFIDGHELIYDMKTDGKLTQKYILTYNFDDVNLKNSDESIIDCFIRSLFQFKIIKLCDSQTFSLETKQISDEEKQILEDFGELETTKQCN